MKIINYHILILLFQGMFVLFGQSRPVAQIDAETIPQEKIFIHHNTTLLLAGEYLYYSFYCRNAQTEKPSTISKIGYVELIGENGTSVFKHKIFLEGGSGQGDFFIPVSAKSGNYKLIGYTQWMKNWGIDQFFQSNIGIVNPYQANQSRLLMSANDSLLQDNVKKKGNKGGKSNRKTIAELSTTDSIVGKRKKVQLTLKAQPGSTLKGNYSLSVRKTYPFETLIQITSEEFSSTRTEQRVLTKEAAYLPEMRGDLISGKIIPKGNKAEKKDIKIAMSVPGKEYMVNVANTNEKGIFYQNITDLYTSDKIIFQVLGEDKENYGIAVDDDVPLDYSDLSFSRFRLEPEMEDEILKRSVHNQIENAYFSVKPDTLMATDIPRPSYFENMNSYDLDDYTRFQSVRETLVEIVNNAWSRRVAGQEYKIQLSSNLYDTYIPPNAEPLIVVDGILMQDHGYLLNYDARKIKTIGVLQDKYILGRKIFQGVMAVETIEGDFSLPPTDDAIVTHEFLQPLERKKYFSPVYTDSLAKKERIPDFRHQLLWKPNIEIKEKETIFTFYTSDVKGEFEISLEGFTAEGKPVTLKERFRVE